jgi:hypothetical protein
LHRPATVRLHRKTEKQFSFGEGGFNMTGYLAMIGLHGDHSIERDKELDLEMEKIEFRPFFIDENERFYLPPGVYLHEGTSTFHSPEDAHAAVAQAAHAIEPDALVLVFQKKQAVYSGSGGFRRSLATT